MSAIFIGGRPGGEEPAKRSARQLLRLIRDALALVWRAAPRY